MKKIIVLIIAFMIIEFIVNSNRCNSQWVLQYHGGESIGLYAIQFVNDNTGYIVGSEESPYVTGSVFLKTTNGGNNWLRINMNLILDHWLYALSFINVNTGFACGRNSYIRKTTDGGQTWASYLAATNTLNFNAIQFLDDQTGYVGGRYGMLAKSTNGGVNWTALDSANSHIDLIHFFDVNTGIIGDAYSGLYRTTNGGLNWSYKYQTDSLGGGYDYSKASFINNNIGFVIGSTYYKGILLKTTNGGINWNIIRTFNNTIGSVYVLNESTIYVGGVSPYILLTTDGGKSWSNQPIPSPLTSALSIYFVNSNTGYTCGSYGAIAKTVNGGVRVENISNEIPSMYSLSQNYPNPFNPSSVISFQLPVVSNVLLKVYDAMGREIQTLVNENLNAGTYSVEFNGDGLSSGVYFYKIDVRSSGSSKGNYTDVKSMVLLK